MFMEDNLNKQIHAYDNIYEYHDKMLFIEKILHYYEHTSYTSNEKKMCYTYWKKRLEDVYTIAFAFF